VGQVKQIWHPYTLWEDFHAGMYDTPEDEAKEVLVSHELLTDPERLRAAMLDAIEAWPFSAEHNLTNMAANRRAWTGQAACMYAHAARRDSTCIAWGLLTDDQRRTANTQADLAIAVWEDAADGIETLFA